MADNAGEWKGASWKQEEDFSKETTELLETSNAELLPVLLRSSDKTINDFVSEMLVLEKKARLGGDALSTSRIAVEVIRMYRSQKLYTEMLEKLDFLMKRRGQMKSVQSAMISECSKALDELPGNRLKKTQKKDDDNNDNTGDITSSETRTKILSQLVHVTAGKIHVELEHARFTVELAHIVEVEQQSKKEAAIMLSDLQVETITQMPRLEKIEIILDQIRLYLEMNDLARVPSVSRKISHRALNKKDGRDLKIKYFQLMGDYYSRLNYFFMVSRCEHEIYLTAMGTAEEVEAEAGVDELQSKAPTAVQRKNTKLAKEGGASSTSGNNNNNNKGKEVVSEVIISPEMERLALNSIANCAILLLISEHLTVKEVEEQAECCAFSPQSMQADRSKWLVELEKNKRLALEIPIIHNIIREFNSSDLIRENVLPLMSEVCAGNPLLSHFEDRRVAFNTRLSEHDMLVIANSFSQVKISRLAELVSLSEPDCENYIMKMVNGKALNAKIDRIDGLVVFQRRRKASEDVEEWNKAVEKVSYLIDKAAHLVVKERMLQRIGAANAAHNAAQE